MEIYTLDSKTTAALDRLKNVYNVRTLSAALKRVIAISVVAAKHADKDGQLHVIDAKRKRRVIHLR